MEVPFAKPSERYMAPLGGHVDVLHEEPGDVKSFVEAKQLRPILLFSQISFKFYPDVPTTHELGYKIGFPNWRGVVVKKGTPPDVVRDPLKKPSKKMTETPEWQKYLVDEMAEPDSFLDSAAFQSSVHDEFKTLDAFAKQYGIK